jgi:hypothetical protein
MTKIIQTLNNKICEISVIGVRLIQLQEVDII